MEKVRIGNDLKVNFSVYRNGEPESFDGATNISTKIVNESYNKTIAHTYAIVDNVIQFNIDALELKQCGKCRVFISYTKDGDYTVDSPAFELVQYTEDTGGTEVIGIEIVKINISGDSGVGGPKGEKGDPGDMGPQGKPLIVLENGNYGNWDESLGIYVDSGVLAAATVDIEDVPVTFDEAALRENILSEETIQTIFGKIKKWFSSLKALAFKDKVDYTTDIENTPTIPSSTSQLSNNSGFITNAVNDLSNYYLKSDTYTKTEVQSLISAVSSLRIESVATLPATGESNVIYLIPRDPSETNNVKLEYIWIGTWEEIGSTDVDLTGYATTIYVDTALSGKANSTHTHNHSDINLSSTARFVTDSEKSTWNGKQDSLGFTPANTTHTHTSSDVTNFASSVRAVVLGGISFASSVSITATDTILSALGKLQKQITDHSAASNPHGITKTDVGLNNVDNTADSLKSVASAAKLTTARNINGVSFNGTQDITITDNTKEPAIVLGTAAQYYRGDKTWQTLDKSAVGLGNVNNTADADKPISTAVQTAIDGKAPSSHGHAASEITQSTTLRFVSDTEKSTWNGKQDALSGDVSGHYHSADRNRANHTGTQTSSTISDFAATVRSVALTGLSLLTNAAITATDSVISALGKLQKQITDHAAASNPHGITKTTVGLGSVDNTADSAKNVLSATKLTTARKINGVNFDGSIDITIADGTKEPTIAAGTTSQYYRGDKTWQTLNKTAVGLGNVDNTTDANKPISSDTQTALNGKAASSHTHAPSDISSPVTIAKGGTGLNALGTAGQFLQVNSAANAMEWVTPRDKGANTVSTLASLPVTKRLVVATVTAATTLSLAANMEIGDELHVIVYNNSSTAKTQPLPNTGAFLSLSGTSISIPAYGYIEINILCRAVNNYIIRAL